MEVRAGGETGRPDARRTTSACEVIDAGPLLVRPELYSADRRAAGWKNAFCVFGGSALLRGRGAPSRRECREGGRRRA